MNFKEKFKSIIQSKLDRRKKYKDFITYLEALRNEFKVLEIYTLHPEDIQFRINRMDKTTIQAYERYILAEIQFQSPKDIQSERKKAMEMLIVGTVQYFHLYFVDLLKHKRYQDFSGDDIENYCQFYELYRHDMLYNEIESQIIFDEGRNIFEMKDK